MTITTMGCFHSNVPDPNLMYGSELPNIRPYAQKTQHAQRSSKRNLIHPGAEPNGISQSHNNWTAETNGLKDRSPALDRHSSPSNLQRSNSKLPQENGTSKKHVRIDLKGDITSYQDAQKKREMKLRSGHRKRELQAMEMSDKVMEEKERLSFTSSWSRTGSRVTSRAPSPRNAQSRMRRYTRSPEIRTHSPASHVSANSVSATFSDNPFMPQYSSTSETAGTDLLNRHGTSSRAASDPFGPSTSSAAMMNPFGGQFLGAPRGGAGDLFSASTSGAEMPDVETTDCGTELTDIAQESFSAGESHLDPIDEGILSEKYQLLATSSSDEESEYEGSFSKQNEREHGRRNPVFQSEDEDKDEGEATIEKASYLSEDPDEGDDDDNDKTITEDINKEYKPEGEEQKQDNDLEKQENIQPDPMETDQSEEGIEYEQKRQAEVYV